MSGALLRRPGWVVFTVMLGTVTVSLNNSALNPAIPVFMAAFDIGPFSAGWLITGFLVAMGMTMPVTGFLGGKFGKRRVYLFGLAGFVGGSVLGAMAGSMVQLVLARCVQGVAGGLMIPLSLALIFEAYPRERRGRMTGLWGSAVMLAPAVGPAVGGLLLESFAWPVLFLMNIPVGLLGWLTGLASLRSAPDKAVPRFDGRGFAWVSLGIAGGLLAIGLVSGFGAPASVLGLLAVVCLTAFVRHELRCPQPLLNLRLFGVATYRLSVVIVVMQTVGIFGGLLLIPLLMQGVLGFGVLDTAAVLVATAVMSSLFVTLGGRRLDAHGPRGVVSLGLGLSALAMLALGQLDASTSLAVLLAWGMVRGAGMGLSYLPATTAGLNAIPDHWIAEGAAMNNILRRLTAALVIVLVSLAYEWRRADLMRPGLTGEAGGLAAINELFTAIGLLLLAALPLALRLPRRRPAADPARPSDAPACQQRLVHSSTKKELSP